MWSLWFYQHNLICSVKTDIVPPCIRSDVCEEYRIYTQGFVQLLECLVNDSSWGEILLICFYYSTCQTINWCSRRVLSAVLSVKKRKQQWKFRFVVRFLEKPQIFKCGAEIRLWNGLSLYNFMKWHEVVCFFKNWRVALTLFEIHICALRVLVWLEIIILLAPCGEKSICICQFHCQFLAAVVAFSGKMLLFCVLCTCNSYKKMPGPLWLWIEKVMFLRRMLSHRLFSLLSYFVYLCATSLLEPSLWRAVAGSAVVAWWETQQKRFQGIQA